MIYSILILHKLNCCTAVRQWQLQLLDPNTQCPLAGFTRSLVSRSLTNSKQERFFFFIINPKLCLQRERYMFENRCKGST